MKSISFGKILERSRTKRPVAVAGSRQAPSAAPVQAGGGELVAQLLARVDALEEQVRQLRGRIDETQNRVQRQGDDLSKRIDDLAFQINPQGARQGGGSGTLLPPSVGQGPALAPVPPPPPRPALRRGRGRRSWPCRRGMLPSPVATILRQRRRRERCWPIGPRRVPMMLSSCSPRRLPGNGNFHRPRSLTTTSITAPVPGRTQKMLAWGWRRR